MNWSEQSRAIGEGRIGGRQIGFVDRDEQPGLLQRFARNLSGDVEYRTISALPWNTGPPPLAPSKIPNAESALALGAVYAAVSLIARTVAGIPLHAYRDINGIKTELGTLPSLFDQPSVQGDLYDWLHRCITSICLSGNAVGLITNRDGFGFPTGIEWLPLEQVTVVDVAYTGRGSFLNPIWRWMGRELNQEDVLHIPWFTRPWKVLGLSPLGAYAATVKTGLGAQEFSSAWFANGGVPPGKFKNSQKTVSAEEANEIKARLVNAIRAHQPVVYGQDWDYEPIAVTPQEAEFIQTMRLTATQIAVIYGVPPERIGGEKGSSMTYANTEQESIDFVQFTVLNYVRKLESAFFKILPARQYVRFNLDALIRTDLRTRYQAYMLSRQMGMRNVDEIRALENLPPLPNGEGEAYDPLVRTGYAPPPLEPGSDTPGALSEESLLEESPLVKLPARQPYQGTQRTFNGNGWHDEYRQISDPPSIPVTVNITLPPMTVERRDGDIIVQPSTPPEVRVEMPVTIQSPEVPVTVNVPERSVQIEAPITVNTPEIQLPEINVPASVVNVALPKPDPPPDVEVVDAAGKVISRTRRVPAKAGRKDGA